MPSVEFYKEWGQRLHAALLRYENAKRHVGETAVERLNLPSPDGYLAHKQSLQEETQALQDYRDLLATFAGLLNR
jgi:hypothetical protein